MFTKDEKSDKVRFFSKLLAKIRKDGQAGLCELYKTYGKMIFNTAASVCRSHDNVDAIINQVLVKIWNFAKTNQKVENPGGFIYVVTINCARDSLRGGESVALNEAISVAEDNIQKFIDEQSFLSLISCLNEYEKSIMIRKFSARDTFKEISEQDQKPLSTITSIYYRCLEKVENDIRSKNYFKNF